jgi:glycine oxidase
MNWLKSDNKLYNHDIHYSDMVIHDDYIETAAGNFRHVIQADGNGAAASPWWEAVPFRRNRGEILLVNIPGMREDLVTIRDCIIVPLGDGLFWVGAYNTWDQLPPAPTAEGKAYLENNLTSMLTVPYELVNHMCGVRPTVRDRTPVCGTHPQFRHLHILNGMGTKGYSMAPWHAQSLVAHMFQDTPLQKTTDVRRFY